jgi:hypothetical protein
LKCVREGDEVLGLSSHCSTLPSLIRAQEMGGQLSRQGIEPTGHVEQEAVGTRNGVRAVGVSAGNQVGDIPRHCSR